MSIHPRRKFVKRLREAIDVRQYDDGEAPALESPGGQESPGGDERPDPRPQPHPEDGAR